MRFKMYGNTIKAVAFATFALSLGAGTALAQSRASKDTAELPPDREEIIITHQRLGPLSDWAAMQQHSADYRRLKAKYDPTTGSSHVDSWANDRTVASHSNANDSFIQESQEGPAPAAVQAIKDAVVPP